MTLNIVRSMVWTNKSWVQRSNDLNFVWRMDWTIMKVFLDCWSCWELVLRNDCDVYVFIGVWKVCKMLLLHLFANNFLSIHQFNLEIFFYILFFLLIIFELFISYLYYLWKSIKIFLEKINLSSILIFLNFSTSF